ncbi:MAG: DNA photolyase, partial [Desulfobacterales bacterium]
MSKLQKINNYRLLPVDQQEWLAQIADTHGFSFQQLRLLVQYSMDLVCWSKDGLAQFYRPSAAGHLKGKPAAAKIFQQLKDGYDALRTGLKSYPDHTRTGELAPASEIKFPKSQIMETDLKGAIMGKCPVASEKTRCCNLNTLDAVQQCGFGCSYCSIQSFYHGNQVRFVRDLALHLENLELDTDRPIHIGTGQSSDSLMWGNR